MKHESVIAIDPGKHTGWAAFYDGELGQAGVLTEQAILKKTPLTGLLPGIAVIELPVIYPLGLGKGDPNDLIGLAVFVGDLRGFYRRRGFDTTLVTPRTWKGTVPKNIHNERVLAALTPTERARLPRRPRARDFDHNMLDAVGLGLWQLEKERQR